MTQATSEQRTQERSRLRAAANNVLLHLHPPRVPAAALRFRYTWGLGGISTLLAVILLVTGVLLVFRYEPGVNTAYLSIQAIETKLFFGSLIRAVHHWSANLLLITVFLHLLRVFFTGGFKQGRGGNWVVGILLLLIVVAFNFTGYLLPWDQLAYDTGLGGYVVDVDRERLEGAPRYAPGDTPWTDPGYAAGLDMFWGRPYAI